MARIGYMVAPHLGSAKVAQGIIGELAGRGHEVMLLGPFDFAAYCTDIPANFHPIDPDFAGAGSLTKAVMALSSIKSWGYLQHYWLLREASMLSAVADLDKLRDYRFDLLIGDSLQLEASTLATSLGCRYVSVASGLPYHDAPLLFGDEYRSRLTRDPWARSLLSSFRFPQTTFIWFWIRNKLLRRLNEIRKNLGMHPFRTFHCASQGNLNLVQGFHSLYGRRKKSRFFNSHIMGYLGPTIPSQTGAREDAVYCQIGPLMHDSLEVLKRVAEACDIIGKRLIISLAGTSSPAALKRLTGDVHVVKFCDQRQILSTASAFISHGGLTSCLESILSQTPTLILPRQNDQIQLATRLQTSHLGEALYGTTPSAKKIAKKLLYIMHNRGLSRRLKRVAHGLETAPGPTASADLIEECLT